MITELVTLHVPVTLYQRIQSAAQVVRRPLEAVLLDAVTMALPLLEDLPPALAEDALDLTLLNDAALWRAARRTWTAHQQEQLDTLLYDKETGELDANGQQLLNQFLAEYEHLLIMRAQAALLLQQRGYAIADPAIFGANTDLL